MEYVISPFYYMGIVVWQIMLDLIGLTSMQTPEMFSESAWNYVAYELYPWFSSIGIALLNMFFLVSFLRQTTNLRQNMTMEAALEICIKTLLGSAFIEMGLSIMRYLLTMASEWSYLILTGTPITFQQEDMDAGAQFFYTIFGIVFFVVCLVCSVTIFLTVYGRYMQLYLLILSGPIALSTMGAGHGVSQTAAAWIRTFLAKTFSIVIIVLSIAVGAKLCASIDFGSFDGLLGFADGFIQALQNIFTIVLLTASVKGADAFMKRCFGL